MKYINSFIIFSLTTYLFGCFPNTQPSKMEVAEIDSTGVISASKCHTKNGSVIIYKDGFEVRNKLIIGNGDMYIFPGKSSPVKVTMYPIDSIIAVTTYDDFTSPRYLADGILGVVGGLITSTAIYCTICPKCCFGSCPTLYTFEENSPVLETELFSHCISRMLESDDMDKLLKEVPGDGNYVIKVTNEALETHYINKLNLVIADHPKGTIAYTDINGGISLTDSPELPLTAVNSEDMNLFDILSEPDSLHYRSGMNMAGKLKEGIKFDFIELTTNVPVNKNKCKLIIRYKNTLLSTILFYDLVLGSQGVKAVEWTDMMNNDPVYAENFKTIYDLFSGIQLEVYENNKWVPAGKIPDAGPIMWKTEAAEIHVQNRDNLKIRLMFIPDNFMIDYAGFDYSEYDANDVSVKTIHPYEIINNAKDSSVKIYRMIESADDSYLVTNPGESYTFKYQIKLRKDCRQTVFISSKGFYNEWIRGSWITNNNSPHRFELFNIKENLKRLAESWEINKELIEREFYKTKIPLREKCK